MNDYKILSDLIIEANNLKEHHATSSAPAFQAWKAKVERFLTKKYGADSYELDWFRKQHFSLPVFGPNTHISHFVNACRNGLLTVIPVLRSYLEEMDEEHCLPQGTDNTMMEESRKYEKVFIVHGHNGEMKEAVARLIEKQGLQAIILHEKPNEGITTIIEKFEKNSDTGAAICLFTADDIGRAKKDGTDRCRARQNVVFEAGYFIGKLGRKNVIIVYESDVEIPSDLSGVAYTEANNWRFSILQELKTMGFSIDYNRIDT